VIDLHLHTSASDGLDRPESLVARVAATGIRVFAVTDHDTVAGLADVRAAAERHRLGWIPGIEITAIENGRDVHVLGYGFDAASTDLAAFLQSQRDSRLERLQEFGRRFAILGIRLDIGPLLVAGEGSGRSVGRAHVARALIDAGHVATVEEAFTRWLAPGRPAFVPRRGLPVAEVVARIHEVGGVASLAHPKLLQDDGLVGRYIGAGIDALEAYHSDHDAATSQRYVELARRGGLAASGGSDHHGETSNVKRQLGRVILPPAEYARLRDVARGPGARRWPEPPRES
jgi:predicted metal-dependent phosphoesterase TrpH